MKTLTSLLAAAVVASCTFGSPAAAQESGGSITIPLSEYEELKKATEAEEENQWWNMTYEQILNKKNGNEEKAWDLYEYWVLRQIHLFGTVNYSSADKLMTDLNVLNEVDSKSAITLVISSPGGAVYNGLVLYNAMLNSKAPIHTICDGISASMAAVLLTAGDYRSATPACHWMIHEVGGGLQMQGQTTDFVKLSEYIVDLENILFEILSENTGLSMSDVRKLAEFETFYSSDEILRLGVVDNVFDNRPRDLEPGTRTIPEDLLPLNRMKKNLTDKLDRK